MVVVVRLPRLLATARAVMAVAVAIVVEAVAALAAVTVENVVIEENAEVIVEAVEIVIVVIVVSATVETDLVVIEIRVHADRKSSNAIKQAGYPFGYPLFLLVLKPKYLLWDRLKQWCLIPFTSSGGLLA